jgi:membrane-bound serine protease (ClpP class)
MILLLALVLFVIEIFVPSGGVLGVLSALALITSIGTAFAYCGLKVGTIFLVCTTAMIPVLIYFAIQWWPMTPIGRRILIQPPDEDQIVPDRHRQRQQWLGKQGVAVTALLPAGAIRVGGQTVDAVSAGMTIEKGTVVEVIAVRGVHLVVRPSMSDASTSPGEAGRSEVLDAVVPDPFDDSLS